MNIFILDTNPKIAAQYHLDKHVVKMILETAQLLCSAHWLNGNAAPYELTHKNHPCSIWTRECIENYNWLCILGLELCKEYTYRYEKIHKTQEHLIWLYKNKPPLKTMEVCTLPPCAMPIECKQNSVVASYRNYYITEKRSFARWTKRTQPEWFY